MEDYPRISERKDELQQALEQEKKENKELNRLLEQERKAREKLVQETGRSSGKNHPRQYAAMPSQGEADRLLKENVRLKQKLEHMEKTNANLTSNMRQEQHLQFHDRDASSRTRKDIRMGMRIKVAYGQDPTVDELRAGIAKAMDIDIFKVWDVKDADAMDTADGVRNHVNEKNPRMRLTVTGKPKKTFFREVAFECGCLRPMTFVKEYIFVEFEAAGVGDGTGVGDMGMRLKGGRWDVRNGSSHLPHQSLKTLNYLLSGMMIARR